MTIFMIILIECLRSQRLLVKRMLELKMAVTPTSVRCSDSHLCCPISNISTTPTALLCISSSTTSSSTSTSQPLPLHCSVLVVVLHLVVLVVLLHLNHSHYTALYYISNTLYSLHNSTNHSAHYQTAPNHIPRAQISSVFL